jgi:transcription elongation GreA/GreB family factor
MATNQTLKIENLNQKNKEQYAIITSLQDSNKQFKDKLSNEAIKFSKLQHQLIEIKQLSDQTITSIQNDKQILQDQLNQKNSMATNQTLKIENLNQKNKEQYAIITSLQDSNKQFKDKLSNEAIKFSKLQHQLIETKQLSDQTITSIQNEKQEQLNQKNSMATNQTKKLNI